MPSWLSLDNVLGIVVTILAGIIAHAVKTPKDHERAALLATLAEAAAAVVVNLMPNAKWTDLLQAVIQRLSGAASVPTKNQQVISAAATAALVKLGKTAPGS